MRKRLIVLLMVGCLIAAPTSVMAEETDYSYLEDMSVKELKDLRDAINKILGDNGGNSETDLADQHPEWAELDAETDPYATAILLSSALKETLYDRDSFQINGAYYYKENGKEWYVIEYSGANQLGGVVGTYMVFKLINGDIKDYYDKDTLNGSLLDYDEQEAWGIAYNLRRSKKGESLDYRFIEYNVE